MERTSASSIPKRESYLPWLGLACLSLLYVFCILRIHPTNFFGLSQDDSIYLSSAQALAQGKGYVLPSLPGTPPATKYPILYSWILSLVWHLNPSFPANLAGATGVTVLFGLCYVVTAFIFLRGLQGLSETVALVLTAFTALHPVVLFYSGGIVADIPFSAFTLLAMLIGNETMRRRAALGGAAASGLLAGLSLLLRILGAPIIAGILLTALFRRAWRQAAIFGACAAPFVVMAIWHSVFPQPANPPAPFTSFGPGWHQTWLYYTDYLGFRRLEAMVPHVTGIIVLNQLLYLFSELPGYFVTPLLSRSVLLLFPSTLAVLWLVLSGMIGHAKHSGIRPEHPTLAIYTAVILGWDYPEWQRFLIPFLPFFAACLWMGVRRSFSSLLALSRASPSGIEKKTAAAFGVALGILTIAILGNLVANGRRSQLRRVSLERAALLAEKHEAYEWLRKNTPSEARVIAGEDVCVFLYTGRQAMSSLSLLHAGAYDDSQFRRDLNHLTDVAQAIGAAYWMSSPDDSDKQWVAAKPLLSARLQEIESVLPEVFRSSGGRVKICGLACVRNPQESACAAAAPVLFPDKYGQARR